MTWWASTLGPTAVLVVRHLAWYPADGETEWLLGQLAGTFGVNESVIGRTSARLERRWLGWPNLLRWVVGVVMAIRVVKRKWDGTVSAVDTAYPLVVPGDRSAWLVHAGTRRERPAAAAIEVVGSDELWVAVPGEWWVLCGRTDAARSLSGYKVHAAFPFEAPCSDDEIVWVDLDLDFDVSGDQVDIQDETQFHEHARSMGYPEAVVRGAWSGISTIAASYTNRDWPFDGTMQEWLDGATTDVERHGP
ncbi:MAG TPA: hypothetical protein VFU85_02130 [Nocardioides sp.]|nr:hypothetical protein [Nocardioides sp.]